MNITFSSLFMSVVWGSMVVMFFSFYLKKRRFIEWFGVTNLVLVYLACALRLFVPVEFPFVRVIGLRGVFAAVYDKVFLENTVICGFRIKIAVLLMAVWLIGIFVVVMRWALPYRRAVRKMYSSARYCNKQSEKVLARVKSKYWRKLHVEVWQSSQVNVPMGIGVFRKSIFLPVRNYTDSELYYILLHEYTHFINGDIIVKVLVHMFCCVFWWNPCLNLLRKEIDQALEIKCDLTVTKAMDENSKVSYLGVIISMIQRLNGNMEEKYAVDASTLFRTGNDVAVVERFQVIMAEHVRPRKTKLPRNLCVALLCGTIGFSYLFQFQAEFPAPSIPAEEEVTPENTYLIDNNDGTYTIVDLLGRGEDTVTNKKWIIDDMILKGFKVEEG